MWLTATSSFVAVSSSIFGTVDQREQGNAENCTMHGMRGQINKCKQIGHVLCLVFDPRFT